jgi:hypothetical protein
MMSKEFGHKRIGRHHDLGPGKSGPDRSHGGSGHDGIADPVGLPDKNAFYVRKIQGFQLQLQLQF